MEKRIGWKKASIENRPRLKWSCKHGRRQRGGKGAMSSLPWIFIHGTDIVDRGLNVLFFGIFFVALSPPGNFSADPFHANRLKVTRNFIQSPKWLRIA